MLEVIPETLDPHTVLTCKLLGYINCVGNSTSDAVANQACNAPDIDLIWSIDYLIWLFCN